MAATYIPIASTTLATAAASVNFSDIPATYTDLVLRFSARATSGGSIAGDVTIRLNSSTTNYSETVLRCYESNTPGSLRLTGENGLYYTGQINGSGTTSNTFSNFEIYLPNYTSSANKVLSAFGVVENNNSTTAYIGTTASLWRITDAITSITLTANMTSGSTFHLYGISNT